MTAVTRQHSINMTDVDLVQVNFSRFFVWMDDGYNALLRELGHPLSEIIAGGFATPLVEARCEYRRPVGLDDQFQVLTAVVAVGRTSYVVAHIFEDAKGVFAVGRATHVWIGTHPSQAAQPVPTWIADAIAPEILELAGSAR
jgi:acyl-CoA thioester hydrolase